MAHCSSVLWFWNRYPRSRFFSFQDPGSQILDPGVKKHGIPDPHPQQCSTYTCIFLGRDQLEVTFTLLGATKVIIYNDLDSTSMKTRLEECHR
jgi:hypothetical protein